jgi:predicted dehydrogenase
MEGIFSMRNTGEEAGKVSFAITGTGWRSEFYLRIAAALPGRFRVSGVVSRSEDKRRVLSEKWNVGTFSSLDELLSNESPDFAVIAVSKDAAPQVIVDTARKNLPILAETPPANSFEGLLSLWKSVPQETKIQVAEQYHLQPMNAARLSLVRSGVLGTPGHAQISATQNYHALSLMRRYLNIGFEDAVIRAFRTMTPVVEGFGRGGLPEKENIVTRDHTIAVFDFGGKTGVYDFERDQHRSWARSNRILVRGERGEISNHDVRYLRDFRTQVQYDLRRISAGEEENLEGYHLKTVLGGSDRLYENPFAPASLSDDEIAIASCLVKMKEYVAGGAEFYSLAEAMQDQYLSLMMESAVEADKAVKTVRQPWAQ